MDSKDSPLSGSYPDTLLVIHIHIENNGLRLESGRRSWSRELFEVLLTYIELTLWMKDIHQKC